MTIKRKRFTLGVELSPADLTAEDLSRKGELAYDSSDDKLKYRNTSATKEVVDLDSTQSLENKTIDATSATGNNTLSADSADIVYDDTAEAVSSLGTNVQDALDAVKVALDNQNDAAEINYDNSTSGLTATDVQAAIDEVEGRLDTAETDITTAQSTADNHIADATDAHTASAITNVPSGNLAATDVQEALDELQSDIDTRALDSNLTAHINDVSDAHDASAITNTPSGNLSATDIQGAVNELQTDIDTRATDADLTTHTGASSGVHGVTGDVVGTSDAQTLTNKIVSGGTVENASIETPTRLDAKQDTLANLQTYAATASNGQYVFATDVKKSFQIIDNNLVPIGSGGGFNYFGDDENGAENSIGTWTVYANTTPDNKPDDFGGTPSGSFTFTRNTSNPLIGDADFQLSKPAANVQGHGVYYEFTPENGHQTLKNLFTCLLDGSDILDEDISIWLVGSDDSFSSDFTYISANNPDVNVSSQIVKQFQFQNKAEYRLCIHYNATDTDAKTVNFDDFQLAPSFASEVSNTVAYFRGTNPSSSSGNSTVQYISEIDNTNSYSAGLFTVPESGYYLVTALMRMNSTDHRPQLRINGTAETRVFSPQDNGRSSYIVETVYVEKGDTIEIYSDDTLNIVVADTSILTICQVGKSEEARDSVGGGRDVVVRGAGNSGSTVTGSTERIDWTLVEDTTGSWSQVDSNGTDTFTAPETGYYTVEGAVRVTSAGNFGIDSFIDGVESKRVANGFSTAATTQISCIEYLQKGQTLDFRFTGTLQLDNSTTDHWIHIQKLANPQAILETETVAARYTSNSGQSVATPAAIFIYEDIDFDTHNAYNTSTGEYTVPISGYYSVTAKFAVATASTDAGLTIRVNGVDKEFVRNRENNGNMAVEVGTSCLYLNKGDVVDIERYSSAGGNATASSIANTFSIARIK